jgi:glutamine synthetase
MPVSPQEHALAELANTEQPLTVQSFAGQSEVEAGDVMAMAAQHGVRMVDLKFTDLPGTWQHLGLSIRGLDEDAFSEGLGFDGSSIRGFQEISESDMLVVPDPATAVIDPFHQSKTLSLICNVIDPVTREPYSRDPRYVAQKGERHLAESGIADVCYFGPEAEFYIFDHVAFDQRAHLAFYEVDSIEAYWNTGQGFGDANHRVNLGHKPRSQEGYFPAPPADSHVDLRSLMVVALEAMGLQTEFHHHEVGGPGQAEIDLRFQPLLAMSDQLQLHKYVVKNVAHAVGKTATFMPKPIFEENGSGMHVHQSLWKDGKNLMFDADGYALVSQSALHYIGGLLEHAAALMAFCAPTTSSYRRLVPGYEAPVNLVYSQRNRSACVRIPVYSTSPASKRLEFRPPDCAANPYLAFTAMMLAGLDGIRKGLDPGEPLDTDLYDLPPERMAEIAQVPASLDAALDALEADADFLLAGDVFTPDLIDAWIEHKRQESDQVRLRPHPWEFALYYDT